MTKAELMEHIDAFFGDTSRSAGATKSALLDAASKCEMLADSIPDAEEDEDDEH